MRDRSYEDVIGNTPAILATHEVAKFRGQSSAALYRMTLDPADIDQPLLRALMQALCATRGARR
jgi:hypothetical protein